MEDVHVDRRRSFRVPIDGLALLWHEDRIAGRYVLRDLSMGGCLLRNGPSCKIGDEYGLVLDLDARAGIRVAATVVRQRVSELGGRDVALAFSQHPPAVERQLEAIVTQLVENERFVSAGRVLVVDANPMRRRDTSDHLRQLGHDVLEATTPLEAVWELENGPMDIHTVFVARILGESDGRDLLRFIGSRYTGVWRVMLADKHEPHGPADAVLLGPSQPSRLRKVLPKPRIAV
jgi:CheY-like chemotaxis protein